jgi:hypothetical protein
MVAVPNCDQGIEKPGFPGFFVGVHDIRPGENPKAYDRLIFL